MLDVVVGFPLVGRQLLATILQTEHPQAVIEALLVDSVLALYLAVVAGCSDADMPVEIFFTLEDDAGYGRHRMENVLIEGNYFLYTGYGWYMRTKGAAGSAYQGYGNPNASENFRIINNVFYLSTGPLLSTGAPQKWQPELDGNTYVQNDGGLLVSWFTEEEGYQRNYPYYYNEHRDTVTDVIRDVLGDENGTAFVN